MHGTWYAVVYFHGRDLSVVADFADRALEFGELYMYGSIANQVLWIDQLPAFKYIPDSNRKEASLCNLRRSRATTFIFMAHHRAVLSVLTSKLFRSRLPLVHRCYLLRLLSRQLLLPLLIVPCRHQR